MAASEIIVGSLQQTMGSSSITSIKPFHLTFEFGRSSCKRPSLSLQASMASKEDQGATMHKENEARRTSRSPVPSLLKAVQEGYGASAVMQQVSSLRHFFMPELPFTIITEIKKRIPLSFREDDDDDDGEEEIKIAHDLSGRLVVEKELEEHLTLMGPRCPWPRAKLAIADERRHTEVQDVVQGPRCAWPRGSALGLDSLQEIKKEEHVLAMHGEVGSGAKCAWPRASSRSPYQSCSQKSASNSFVSANEGNFDPVRSSREDTLDQLKGHNNSSSNPVQEPNSPIIQGPRCTWPRSTPRRMLATGVGLGLVNFLFIDQGVPALAILFQTPFAITGEDNESLSPHKSLLP